MENQSGELSPGPLATGGSSVTKTPVIPKTSRSRGKRKESEADEPVKRKCVSTACIACRKRKSKCDGNLPACAACSSVYYTECVYDPNSDHRRKGVYRKDEKLKTRNTTLEVLIQALLNAQEDKVPDLVKQIRTCESLDTVAEALLAKDVEKEEEEDMLEIDEEEAAQPTFENQLSSKMGDLRLEEGSARYIGGTSNLLFLAEDKDFSTTSTDISTENYMLEEDDNPISSWTNVTDDSELVQHLIQMYFTWHYTYFTTLSKSLFFRDFYKGRAANLNSRKTEYCTPLLVNAMLALGCHFTAWPAARENREDSSTAGDHFFKECKRLIMSNDEYEKPKLATVQALALMSVREAGCGREAKGWVYSGMSFRMACDLGLNLDSGAFAGAKELGIGEEEIDARRITFWGCFLFDKCWSNYLGRMPQLPISIITVPKFDVFPSEDAEIWVAYTDSGPNQAHAQPSRTRAVALQISQLCEISNDLMNYFYNPIDQDKSKSKQSELKKLSEIHGRLEEWKRNLPIELEPKEGGLPSMLVMHMFYQLLYIHLFRPFLKYSQATSPLPPSISPRRLCTNAAATISKLLRLYKRSHGLRQICNIAVYIAHSACTIHLLNLPDKNAKRDITHGVKHLEEIADSWLCARRTLAILSVLSRQWKVELPDEAATVLKRTDIKFAAWNQDIQSKYSHGPKTNSTSPASSTTKHILQPSPNMFVTTEASSVAGSGPGPLRNSHMVNSPDTLPPNTAAEVAMHNTHASPAATSVVAPSRGSFDSTGSPSAMFGGVDQLLRQGHGGDDWWINDQRQLANGFSHWPGDFEASWAVANQTGRVVTEAVVPDEAILQAMLDGQVNPMANGSNADGYYLPGGLAYPNESEWYQ